MVIIFGMFGLKATELHGNLTQKQRIESLMKEYEKVVTINAEIEKAEEILEDSAEGQRLRYIFIL